MSPVQSISRFKYLVVHSQDRSYSKTFGCKTPKGGKNSYFNIPYRSRKYPRAIEGFEIRIRFARDALAGPRSPVIFTNLPNLKRGLEGVCFVTGADVTNV